MILAEKHIIKKTHPYFKEVDKLCFLSKNLYNRANYVVRQTFIETSKLKQEGKCENATYLNFYEIRRRMKDEDEYKALPAKVSNAVLIKLDKNWKSFFASIKDYSKNPHKYTGRPCLPRYKDKIKGRFLVEYELGAISKVFLKEGKIKLSKTNITLPFINKGNALRQVRIVPINNICYKIEILYVKEEKKVNFRNDLYAGVDLGINNLITITSNKKGLNPVIINGRPVKSINQYYNKTKAKFTSELPKEVYISKRINFITNKRGNKIDKYFHQASKWLINHCLENEIKTICLGKNKFWKQEVGMGKKSNQSFVSIPFGKLISQIEYKAKLAGLNVILTEESYTSKASFLNMDSLPKYDENKPEEGFNFSGYRESRGLYKIKGRDIRINADVNGSLNIIRKGAPKAFADGVEGISVYPVKVTFDK